MLSINKKKITKGKFKVKTYHSKRKEKMVRNTPYKSLLNKNNLELFLLKYKFSFFEHFSKTVQHGQ